VMRARIDRRISALGGTIRNAVGPWTMGSRSSLDAKGLRSRTVRAQLSAAAAHHRPIGWQTARHDPSMARQPLASLAWRPVSTRTKIGVHAPDRTRGLPEPTDQAPGGKRRRARAGVSARRAPEAGRGRSPRPSRLHRAASCVLEPPGFGRPHGSIGQMRSHPRRDALMRPAVAMTRMRCSAGSAMIIWIAE
jgi:hypothetical protein